MSSNSQGAATGPDDLLQAGFDMVRAGRIPDAEQLCLQLQARGASPVRVQSLAAAVAEAKSGPLAALAIADAALAEHGEDAELLARRAQLLMTLRRREEGVAAARRAAGLAVDDPRLLQALAKIHTQRNEPGEAKPLLARARTLLPDDPAILYDTAVCHFYLNEMDEAATLLERVLALAPGNGFALHVRSQLATQTAASNHVEELRATLRRPRLRKTDAISAYFALAKELEDFGEYAESFEALREGNRLKRSTLAYDVRNDLSAMQVIMANYTREALAGIPAGDPDPAPIFIVGLPRTGTTLVERILGSHPEVAAVGEVVDFPAEMTLLAERAYVETKSTDPDYVRASLAIDFAELGRNYVARVRPLAAGRPRTVDKLPFNFRYCGLIHKALPNARIVHLTRDPLDACYAIYKTLFINAYHYSYQLDELAQFYVAYRRTMEHWHDVLPGVIYDLGYERLVEDPAGEARRLLEWCGLEWRDDVLDFHRSRAASTTASAAQVRKPIYRSSVLKWRNYERQMQPVVRKLAEAGLVDEAGNPVGPSVPA